MTDAVPSDPIVPVPNKAAEAPDVGAVNVRMPPATGSTGLFAVTFTASGFANAIPSVVDCGVLPTTGVIVNPWLWNAPMSGGESSDSPR